MRTIKFLNRNDYDLELVSIIRAFFKEVNTFMYEKSFMIVHEKEKPQLLV